MSSGSAVTRSKTANGRRSYRAATVLLVGGIHLGLFAALGLSGQGPSVVPEPAPIVVELLPPLSLPEPPPPPAPQPTRQSGGGAPATASRLHRPPTPLPEVIELPLAPPVPAPEPELTLGTAPRSDPAPGLGQGGIGDGRGTGLGSGDGPGQGSGPRFVRGATNGEILSLMPRELQRRRGQARSEVRCQIRPDTRLDACTLVSEQPPGLGYGAIAVRVVESYFRFSPPTDGAGRPVSGTGVTVTIDFPRR